MVVAELRKHLSSCAEMRVVLVEHNRRGSVLSRRGFPVCRSGIPASGLVAFKAFSSKPRSSVPFRGLSVVVSRDRRTFDGVLRCCAASQPGTFHVKKNQPTSNARLDRVLEYQRALAAFSRVATEALSPERLMHHACAQISRVTHIKRTKVLRYRPDRGDLLVVAGVGWKQGVVGIATLPIDSRLSSGPINSDGGGGHSRRHYEGSRVSAFAASPRSRHRLAPERARDDQRPQLGCARGRRN